MPPINSAHRRFSEENISNVKRSVCRAETAATSIRQKPSQISLRWAEVAMSTGVIGGWCVRDSIAHVPQCCLCASGSVYRCDWRCGCQVPHGGAPSVAWQYPQV